MENQLNEEISNSLMTNRNNNNLSKDDNIGINCLRKKYRCVMIWLLSIISISQFLIIIFEKLDEKFINKFAEKMYNLIKSSPNSSSTYP